MLFNLTQFWYDRRHKLSPVKDSKKASHASSQWVDSDAAQSQKTGFTAGLAHAAATLWRAITVVDTEPRVQKHADRSGRVFWKVYDPMTNETNFFDSENQVRVWLEERYTHSTADRWQPIVKR